MIGNWFLRIAVLFGLVGMGLGIRMGILHDFTFAPVHAHLNLVGFATLFLAGLFYRVVPAADGLLARIHLGLAAPGALALTIGIAGSVTNMPWGVPVAIAGSLATIAGMGIFAVAVYRMTGAPSRAPSPAGRAAEAAV